MSEQARKITLPKGRFTPQKNFANRTQSRRATLLHYHQKHQMLETSGWTDCTKVWYIYTTISIRMSLHLFSLFFYPSPYLSMYITKPIRLISCPASSRAKGRQRQHASSQSPLTMNKINVIRDAAAAVYSRNSHRTAARSSQRVQLRARASHPLGSSLRSSLLKSILTWQMEIRQKII